MRYRLKHEFRELTKKRFGLSDEHMTHAEETSSLVFFPNGKGEFDGGRALEFWSVLLQKKIGIVFPVGCFDEDTEEDNQEDDE